MGDLRELSKRERITALYEAINRRDVEGALVYVDEGCVYEDVNFRKTFLGAAEVRGFFAETCGNVPEDLLFVIDDCAEGEGETVALLWHIELAGIPFPNGRGVGFYRFSAETGKLVFARDISEPPLKLGRFALLIVRFVAPLARRFLKPAASESSPQSSPQSSAQLYPGYGACLWIFTVIYLGVLILSPKDLLLPGDPLWALQPETIQELLDESLNFFFVLPIVNQLGLTVLESPPVHPVTQAFFNFAEAWIFMFLPLLLADPRGYRLPRPLIWLGAMFLTNIFLLPYMGLRCTTEPDLQQSRGKGFIARSFGWTGLVVGAIAVVWFLAVGDVGGVGERLGFFGQMLRGDRVTIAFALDIVLFSVFQGIILGGIMPPGHPRRGLRWIPFWGLGLWLIL
ncbi:nuclear transport factor 2 family protein [Geitlerinema sp. P-1104]|uniref:nuclear transport factor 2 family protein n=1 Tax=Geitlerinema sp. P-1104 TaxID=2546230 RepID=UPI0014774EFC|nr:nuclear transport factor 2 family protein [Geitlerinema sp. P-1104]NMG57161.1 nuclear transport factor 2 family protein [Geitlerinema sp. P-1104]